MERKGRGKREREGGRGGEETDGWIVEEDTERAFDSVYT